MTGQAEWWESFFGGLWLDVQRQAWTEEQTRAEADFIEELLQLKPPARVLDVPCGEGRLSIELASRGYQVTGVDITLPLLEDAQRRAAERQLEIVWQHRDMRDLPWQEEFDAAFCFWGSFGYFDDEGNADFLKAVFRALKPGGRFLVETHIAETLLPRFQERDWGRVGDTFVLQERTYDHLGGRIDAGWTLLREGRTEKRSSSIRLYTYRELCQLLRQAGFEKCEGYETLTQEPFKLGSRRLTLRSTKYAVRNTD